MNVKKIILGAVALITIATCPARAQQDSDFTEREFTLDVFGFGATRDRGGADKSAWGYCVGVNYFLTRNLGVGADSYADAFKLLYQLNFSGIYRYPLESISLAPYAYAGFGRQWDNRAQWLGHIGGGAEYRLSDRAGFFADIRGVFPETTRNAAVLRFGFRLKFF